LLSAQQLANSKLARQIDSRAFNPNYTFTATMEQFSLGELAAPIIAFGDSDKGTADRALVEYFFGEYILRLSHECETRLALLCFVDVMIDSTNATENERLPTTLGWSKKNSTVTLKDILTAVQHIRNATNLLTGVEEEAGLKEQDGGRKARDLHFGRGDF